MKKLMIDYEPLIDFYDDIKTGSTFYFDTLDELFEFIKVADKNSYHSYYIEDFVEGESENNA